jgi:6-pyruvoyltetrahydropterin/6-carboxytetrahydropterin synthase
LVLLDVNPTAENIARVIFDRAAAVGLPVTEVVLWETANSYATYRPAGVAVKPVQLTIRGR